MVQFISPRYASYHYGIYILQSEDSFSYQSRNANLVVQPNQRLARLRGPSISSPPLIPYHSTNSTRRPKTHQSHSHPIQPPPPHQQFGHLIRSLRSLCFGTRSKTDDRGVCLAHCDERPGNYTGYDQRCEAVQIEWCFLGEEADIRREGLGAQIAQGCGCYEGDGRGGVLAECVFKVLT